ncbi:response regulator [Hymenobacter koreensis]|uniref:Response regulator n=1 Tax=Hymenobacter koreensis TaxID=1084523 RepID=A0ABP8J3C3_9BACT
MKKLPCVLLVDDDQTANFLNASLLRRLEVAEQVLVAQEGAQALALLQEYCASADSTACPALVLLDISMPGMNGIEFLAAYQQLVPVQKRRCVVVVLTTSLHPRDVAQVHQFPVDGFLDKPLTPNKLNDLLKQHFQWELPAV